MSSTLKFKSVVKFRRILYNYIVFLMIDQDITLFFLIFRHLKWGYKFKIENQI